MAIAIEERDVEESFVRAAGPGGQYVNKVATAVQLRFDIRTLAIAARRCAGHTWRNWRAAG